MKVIILGDELGLGEPMKLALENAGHDVVHCLRTEEALLQLQGVRFDYAFIDFMLPGGVNGVDFVQKVLGDSVYHFGKTKIVFLSAVFTDKEFVNDAIKKTKAIAFVKKQNPFPFDEILKLVKHIEPKVVKNNVYENRKALYSLFASEKMTPRQKRRILESQEEVSGFDLPFIYSLLVETKISGYLNIYEKNGAVYGLTISEGNIVGVDLEDTTTFFGEMLIQGGYAVPSDVQTALADKGTKKIGLRLLESNQLSPHAFELVLLDQMNLRLSRTISPEIIRINFAVADVEMTSPSIDSELLSEYLHDWIASKINHNWLKTLYVMWNGYSIEKAASFNDANPVFKLPLLQGLPGISGHLEQKLTLSQLQENTGYNEVSLLKGIHLLLTKGLVVFGGKAAFRNPVEHLALLKKIEQQINGKDAFGIMETLGADIGIEFSVENVIGPEPVTGAPELMKLWVKLKKSFEEAIKGTSDTGLIEKGQADAKAKELSIKLGVAQKIESVKGFLQLNQYQKAQEVLETLQGASQGVECYHLVNAWTKLGLMDPAKKALVMKEVDFELMQIPAEEKYDAIYPFVLGLAAKAKGDTHSARKNFEKSMALNASFMPARRELSALANPVKGQNDILSMDLKGVVGGLFSKKK